MSLRRLLELPIDILYQTLQWLSPRDAVELSAALPEFHVFLSSPEANTVWIKLLRAENAPQHPNGFPYLKWADLLFGALICESCGKGDTLPNFCLMRRICQNCLDKPHNIVISREPIAKDKGPQSPLRDMVFNYTTKHYGSGSGPTVRIYWKADWEEIKRSFEQFKANIAGDDVEDKLGKFIEERKALVLLVSKKAGDMQPWINELSRKNAADKVEQKLMFAKLIRSRCLDAGYDPRDVQSVALKLVALATPKKQFTDADWSALLPRITQTLAFAKSRRLERERAEIIISRRSAIARLYLSIARELPAEQWAALPGAEYVMGVGVFKELINDKFIDGGSGEMGKEEFDIDHPKFAHLKLRERMRSEIEGWGLRRRQRLLKVLRAGVNEEAKNQNHAKQEHGENENQVSTKDDDRETGKTPRSVDELKKDTPPRAEIQLEDLDLATTVLELPPPSTSLSSSPSSPSSPTLPFPISRPPSSSRSVTTLIPTPRSSKSRRVCISWADVVPVLRRDGDGLLRSGLQWSSRGSGAVRALIALINTGLGGEPALRVETAQPKDLDRVDARIQCMDCREHTAGAAMTWRECVHHFIEDTTHCHPNFYILSPSDSTAVKQCEDSVALAKTFLYTCNRCTHFFPQFVQKELVLEHLQTKHGTASSVVGVDVVTQYDEIRPKDAIVMHTLSQEAFGTCTSEPTA
ncbi:hypothetical protein PLEOSDRAFT_1114039 [Pleurotus ostreatus PC15]|uniref:F-box domain-containing protein n=1 Tax=Pleurotus ostreatus (strain PC15) TaxID=1137138 RepID=A0A067NB33_PLEO1|nr:hypothetical protein PLEOSDRAFT_1114039 [Pleurotus ostreatus PC15]